MCKYKRFPSSKQASNRATAEDQETQTFLSSSPRFVPVPLRNSVLLVPLLVTLVLPAVGVDPVAGQFAWFPTVVDQGDSVGTHTSLAFDGTGRPHIAYLDEGRGLLKYAVLDAGTWTIRTVDALRSIAGPTSLALNASGIPHIAYFDGANLRFARRDGPGWNLSTVDLAHEDGAHSLAIGRDGKPQIAYAWDTGSLRLARWSGDGWVRETVETETLVARHVSLVLDPVDRAHIAYNGNGALRYARWTDYRWIVETVDPSQGSGWFNRLALDDRGWPRIAHYDSADKDLQFASWDGLSLSWRYEVIDSSGDAGWDVGFALDPGGRPHLSYYERLSSDLRYASKVGASWERQTVDAEGVVGWYTSLALNGSGLPFIAYYDWTRGALRFASARIEFQVRTISADSVGLTNAILRGELASLGAFPSADVSFEWRGPDAGGWNRTPALAAASPFVFRQTLEGLAAGQEYEFRMVGVADGVTVRGETVKFRLLGPPPPPPSPLPFLAGLAAGASAAILLFAHLWSRRAGRIERSRREMTRDEMTRP